MLVANARTALIVALKQLDVHEGQKILIPDYICDVLIHPILQMKLIPVYYPVTNELLPDWLALESLVKLNHCIGLLMVHYFGQPQNINLFKMFCAKHDLLLIEDNAHGYGGYFEGKLLGTFGDIGVASPRKLLGTPSGGVLYANTITVNQANLHFKPFPIYNIITVLKIILNLVQPLKRSIQSWLDRNTDWSNPFLYAEKIQPYYKIDKYSAWRIGSANWKGIAQQRRDNWIAWQNFALNNGLTPIFSTVHPESSPWAFPVYVNNFEERNCWLKWGVKNKVGLFSWPSLPEQIVNLNSEAFNRWKIMFCFPLNINPDDLKLSKK